MNFIMKKTFKKIAASVMAVAILSTGVTGILANAASANISISIRNADRIRHIAEI